jgi:hypothetical protein
MRRRILNALPVIGSEWRILNALSVIVKLDVLPLGSSSIIIISNLSPTTSEDHLLFALAFLSCFFFCLPLMVASDDTKMEVVLALGLEGNGSSPDATIPLGCIALWPHFTICWHKSSRLALGHTCASIGGSSSGLVTRHLFGHLVMRRWGRTHYWGDRYHGCNSRQTTLTTILHHVVHVGTLVLWGHGGPKISSLNKIVFALHLYYVYSKLASFFLPEILEQILGDFVTH